MNSLVNLYQWWWWWLLLWFW